jgi:hypothetical protein
MAIRAHELAFFDLMQDGLSAKSAEIADIGQLDVSGQVVPTHGGMVEILSAATVKLSQRLLQPAAPR